MTLPFTTAQFLKVFAQYNSSIWPGQLVAYALGILAILLVFYKSAATDRLACGVLGVFWLWNGTIYHLSFLARISAAAYVFAALFIMQGTLFLVLGMVRGEVSFSFKLGWKSCLGGLLVITGMVLYPFLAGLAGHFYPRTACLGVAPCPTAIFTFGLLLWTDKDVPRPLLAIPALWALIGFSAALVLGIYEDLSLLAAGIAAMAFLWPRTPEPAPGESKPEPAEAPEPASGSGEPT